MAANQEVDNQAMKLAHLTKFRKMVADPVKVDTPFDFLAPDVYYPKYKKFKKARIIKQDHDRMFIVDFLIANMFKVYLLLYDKNW